VEAAVAKKGGTQRVADSLWAWLSGGKPAINFTDFAGSRFLGDALPPRLNALKVAIGVVRDAADAAAAEAKITAVADKALDLFLKDKSFLQGLADQSATLVPVSRGKVLAQLWGIVNPGKAKVVTEDDLRKAILPAGGSSDAVEVLWKKLHPGGKGGITVGDFATSNYLVTTVNARLKSLQADVEDQRIKDAIAPTGSNSILDDFVTGDGGSVLDFFV
jgi:hypothetical protein